MYARFFLQRFSPGARVLTDKETKGFLCAADDDSDGRIGADGERIHTYLIYPFHIFEKYFFQLEGRLTKFGSYSLDRLVVALKSSNIMLSLSSSLFVSYLYFLELR